jgi:hypothetical protein
VSLRGGAADVATPVFATFLDGDRGVDQGGDRVSWAPAGEEVDGEAVEQGRFLWGRYLPL